MPKITKANLKDMYELDEENGVIIINPNGRSVQRVPAHEAGRVVYGLIHALDERVDTRNFRVQSSRNADVAYRYDKGTGVMIEEMKPITMAGTPRNWVATGRRDPGYRGPDGALTHLLTSHLAALLLVVDGVRFECALNDKNKATIQKYLELAQLEPAARQIALEQYIQAGGASAMLETGAGGD